MRIDAFYILYAVGQDFISYNGSSATQKQHLSACAQRLSCVDRLNNLMSSIEMSRIGFFMVYARPRAYVGNHRGGLPVSFIAEQMNLAIREESKPGVGYILLGDGDATINITSFASWGMASPKMLIQLMQVIGQQNIRYIFVRWPCHTIEVTQDVIYFVFPLPLEFKERPIRGNSQEIIRLLVSTEETQRYLLALWPDFEEQTKDCEDFFSLGRTYIEL